MKTQFTPIAVQIPEACRISGLGRTRLYDAINEGKIQAVKNGKRTLVLVDSIREFLTSLPSAKQ